MPQYDDITLIRPEAVAAVCGMLTQPGACQAVGFTGTTNPRTAKARFPSSHPKRWQDQPTAANRQCPRNETVEVYFNDTPLLRKIAYNANSNAYTANYDLFENGSQTLFPDDGNGFLHFTHAQTANMNGFNPHSPTLCVSTGTSGQRQFWVDTTTGNTATVTVTCNVAPTSLSNDGGIQFYRYNSGAEDFEGLPGSDPGFIPFVSGTTVYTFHPTISDDYTISIINAEEDTLVAGWTVSFSTSVGIWAHVPMEVRGSGAPPRRRRANHPGHTS